MVDLIPLEDVVVILAEKLYEYSGDTDKQNLILGIVDEISKIPTLRRKGELYEIR